MPKGSSIAHSNRSMPVFNLVMPTVTRAVIERHPVETMKPGDVYVTNDPWLCAGHLDDIATITPVFHRERVVAFAVTIAHTSSIGGSLSNRTVRDIYEEGLRIPILKLYDAGQLNETAWAFIRENVRTPEMVLTDIEAQLTANDLGVRAHSGFSRGIQARRSAVRGERDPSPLRAGHAGRYSRAAERNLRAMMSGPTGWTIRHTLL